MADLCLDKLVKKTHLNRVGWILPVFCVATSVILTAVLLANEPKEEDQFKCYDVPKEAKLRDECYDAYNRRYNKFNLPLYGHILIEMALIMIVYIVYSSCVSRRIEKLASSQVIQVSAENQIRPTERKLFCVYMIQVFMRCILVVGLYVKRYSFMFPSLTFPEQFSCSRSEGDTSNVSTTSTPAPYICKNPQAAIKTGCGIAWLVVTVSLCVLVLSVFEIIYLACKATKDTRFTEDRKFWRSYLNGKSVNDQIPNPDSAVNMRLVNIERSRAEDENQGVPLLDVGLTHTKTINREQEEGIFADQRETAPVILDEVPHQPALNPVDHNNCNYYNQQTTPCIDQDHSGTPPEIIHKGDLEGVKRILLEQGNDLLLKKKFGEFKETALHLAVKHGHESIVKHLLEIGADIHATDHHLRTVLHTAVDETDGIKMITLILLCQGVKVNATEEYGNTPVKLAAEKGNISVVKLLMEKGADITIADKSENTTLHVAVTKGHKQVLEMLLKRVAGTGIIGKQNKDKNTPLHLAVERQRPQCVAMLLKSGAGTTLAVQNKQHQTPVELANGNKEIIDLLNNPDKAAEILPKKAKPAAAAEIGRGGSVKTDSLVPVQIRAENVFINQQYTTTVKNGNVAIGPGSQVVNAQDATANARPQPQLSGQSNYNVNIEGGNASMGDYCVTNVGAGTPRRSKHCSVL